MKDTAGKDSALIKRSVTLKGHRTSIALEPPFWEALEVLAARRSQSLAQLILQADLDRRHGLASALRLLALEAARRGEV